jgi:hypothetical protein
VTPFFLLFLSFCRQAYGFEMSEEEIDEILRVRENAASQGYDRFFRVQEGER